MQIQTIGAQQELFITSYRENFAELLRYAQSKVGDLETGKDLVQDAFLKIWLYMSLGREISNMKSFSYHVLKNLIVDKYRKHKTLSLDALLDGGYEPSVNGADSIIDGLDAQAVLALIGQLPILYERILRMKYEQNLSVRQIASLSGKSDNSVSVCLHRGVSKLKALSNRVASAGQQAVAA